MKDTPLQKSCKEFVDEIINTNNYNNIITLGHSKGGNLAQYVAIKCDKINILRQNRRRDRMRPQLLRDQDQRPDAAGRIYL